MGKADGRVKILADAKTDRILGVHSGFSRQTIAEAVAAMEFSKHEIWLEHVMVTQPWRKPLKKQPSPSMAVLCTFKSTGAP